MEPLSPIEDLVRATVAVFHRLKLLTEEIHGGELPTSKRGLLKSLQLRGPQTMPQLARARPVSRQHVRAVIEPLVAEGLVEFADNPEHRRSKLVQLTAKGLARVQQIDAREAKFWTDLKKAFHSKDVEAAAALLWRFNEFLSAGDWTKRSLKRPGRKP